MHEAVDSGPAASAMKRIHLIALKLRARGSSETPYPLNVLRKEMLMLDSSDISLHNIGYLRL